MLKGLPEPYIKRTVEGDIGMRYSIRGIVDAAGIKTIAELAGVSEARAEEIIGMFAANTDLLPTDDETERLDEALACMAVRTAVTRHAGRIEEAYSMMGTTYVQTGKDLRKVQKLVVTGGSLIHTTNTAKIASFALYDQKEPTSLRPLRADVLGRQKIHYRRNGSAFRKISGTGVEHNETRTMQSLTKTGSMPNRLQAISQ